MHSFFSTLKCIFIKRNILFQQKTEKRLYSDGIQNDDPKTDGVDQVHQHSFLVHRFNISCFNVLYVNTSIQIIPNEGVSAVSN